MAAAPRPHIGVFDSGFGGLTVLRALLPRIPGAHYTYLGDTARLPYGAKSQATIASYAVSSALFLEQHGADLLVIACNTASALALDEIRAAVRIPVLGVIQPGAGAAHAEVTRAEAAHAAAERDGHNGRVLVLATAATVQSHAYYRACASLDLEAREHACPLLVPLIEEGWIDHPVTREVLGIYLREALADFAPAAVLLGCTHYPLIASEVTTTLRALACPAPVIDSAQAMADATAAALHLPPATTNLTNTPATFTCFATDSVEKFERLGSLFLQRPLGPVQLLDLGG